ncbi:MAG: beta-lactamase family protein [Ignavibacteriales bacterium]|nr:beta-lactamase family protein [Ignavibacteriales bacterium]
MKNYIYFIFFVAAIFSYSQSYILNNDCVEKFIEETQELLDDYWDDNDIPGLAFAIFNNEKIIYQECLGKSTYEQKITNETLFSIQSISKNVTALAVMFAVQEGLVALDVPISNYLPDFRVNSCFEENPEQIITLRMLLSHTAGFTHEAPVGNNFDCRPYSFEEHVNSIKDTWLKFPVGVSYSYSNLGVDFAAKIIEVKSGMPFEEFLKNKIFIPLGMNNSTINDDDFCLSNNKTEGTISSVNTAHYKIPLIGSGAVYTNLLEFVNYVQLQMNYGKLKEQQIISQEYLNEIYKIQRFNYALGTYIDKSDTNLYINHNGGGYGFAATMLWFPEYNLAAVLLINNQSSTFEICEEIINNYIEICKPKKDKSIAEEFKKLNDNYFNNKEIFDVYNEQFCTNDTIFKSEWEKYLGTYSIVFTGFEFDWQAELAFSMGYIAQEVNILHENNVMKISSNWGESILREYKPGMFFTTGGDVVNYNSEIPTYKNLLMEKK